MPKLFNNKQPQAKKQKNQKDLESKQVDKKSNSQCFTLVNPNSEVALLDLKSEGQGLAAENQKLGERSRQSANYLSQSHQTQATEDKKLSILD